MALAALGGVLTKIIIGKDTNWVYRRWCVIGTMIGAFYELNKIVDAMIAMRGGIDSTPLMAVVDQMVILMLGTVGVFIGGAEAGARFKEWIEKKHGNGARPEEHS